MIIDCISDLHGELPKLEGGDVLIVAGDLTISHKPIEFDNFFEWLRNQDYKYKIVIGGNHDSYLQKNIMYGQISMDFGKQLDGSYDFYYLCEASVTIEGVKFFGTPWTSTFDGINPLCKAFTVDGEIQLRQKWKIIPEDTDVLITHCPPYGIGDLVKGYFHPSENVGSIDLLDKVLSSNIRLHVFGHIHNGYGVTRIKRDSDDHETIYVNASIMNDDYEPVNKPIKIIL